MINSKRAKEVKESCGGVWNYRLVRKVGEFHSMPWKYLGIHEVYYDKGGIPRACTKEPISVGSDDSIEDIREQLRMMGYALDKPILEYSYFEELAGEGKAEKDD